MTPEQREHMSKIYCKPPSDKAWESRPMTEEEKAQYRLNHGYEPDTQEEWLRKWMNYEV